MVLNVHRNHKAYQGRATTHPLSYLFIHQRTTGHPHLHAHAGDAEEVGVVSDGDDDGAQRHPHGVQIGLHLCHPAVGREEADQTSQQQRLHHANPFLPTQQGAAVHLLCVKTSATSEFWHAF